MDDLHLDTQLAASVAEDHDADGATAGSEGTTEALPQVGLVNDGQGGLDLASLGHGDDGAILHVKDTVLLEDRAEHGLDNNAGGGVGDERRLLVQVLGEEVDTQVAVLASGVGGRDADDLARTALEHQDVAHADVVAGDGDRVGDDGRRGSNRHLTDDLDVMVMVVVVRQDLVRGLVQTLAERVVLT